MQTKLGSLTEAGANIAVGFTINWTANMLVLPLFGFAVTGAQAFGIGLVFTVISLVRSYVLRRWFNGLRFGNRQTVVAPIVVNIDHDDVQRVIDRAAADLRRDLGMGRVP